MKERIYVRGGRLDGKTIEIEHGLSGFRVPYWDGETFYTDNHPTMPINVPAFSEITYTRTDEVVDGCPVFEG